MSLPETPGILIDDPKMVWCPDHLEPFRPEWPAGYLPATVCLIQQALKRADVQAAAGGNIEPDDLAERLVVDQAAERPELAQHPVERLALGPTGPDRRDGVAECLRRYGPNARTKP